MALHIVKLCVGAESVEDLAHWQARLIRARARAGLRPIAVHDTRMSPKRADEVLDGGSLYWVIKGVILVRQAIVSLETLQDREGRAYCEIGLDPEIVPVAPTRRQAFQGWRYFKAEDAPPDLKTATGGADLPQDLARELRDAGVW